MEDDTHHSDKLCDICGHVGFKELAKTCSRCHMTHEHLYCMRVHLKVIPDVWVCEECLPRAVSPEEDLPNSSDIAHQSVMHSAASRKVSVCSGMRVHSKKLKDVGGKVKFLPTAEVIRLSSGAQKIGSPQKPKFSLSREKVPPSAISSGFMKPTTHGAKINGMINQQEAEVPKRSKEERALVAPANKRVIKEQPMDALIPAKEVEPSSTPRISPIISLGEREPSHHVIEPKNLTFEERDLLDVLPNPTLFCPYLPAVEPTWKGGFNFFDTATPGQFYGGFQAQPPCSVRRKAFEVSRKLPLVLQVELLPRCHILADLFGDDCPDFEDIALYFFPADNIERSKQNISCLFEFLEVQNSVMTSYIDGVELLIFTSQHLHKDSQRIIKMTNTECFLWGVFRHVKSDQNRPKVHEELPSLLSPMDCASDDHGQMDNIEATDIDMDIDMEGGRIVGRIDKVVPKPICEKTIGSHEKGDLNSATERMSLECKQGICDHSDVLAKISEKIESKFTFDHISDRQGKFAKVKVETNVPPGFEERSRLSIGIKKEKIELVDQVNDMKETTGLQGASSRGAFGTCSPEPEKPLEVSNSARSQKVHQGPTADPVRYPLAVSRPSLAAMGSKIELQINAERNDEENPSGGGEKKELDITPSFNGHTDSCNGKEDTRDENRNLVPYLVEEKTNSKDYLSVCSSSSQEKSAKLSIEGSSMGRVGSIGSFGIVRDESGKWVVGYTQNLGNCSRLTAELRALYEGLKLVREQGFKKVVVESASSEAVKCLEQTPGFCDPNRDMIRECRNLVSGDWDCRVESSKEEKLCADFLATDFERQPLGKLFVFKKPPSV